MMRTIMRQGLLLGSLFLFTSSLFAASAINEYQLDNGLKLIVKEDHRAPVVLSSVWYKVGGSYEHNGITGISHVLEHMMFRGTKTYKPGELERMISAVGGQQNAMTGNDFTMYYQLLSAKELPLSFKLESDRMHNLLLNPKDFKKEIQVVMEERRMRVDDNPIGVLMERFLAAAHVNNPYHHQTIGWMTDLQNMTDENVIDWYRTWYQPSNAVVIVVGDVKSAEVLQLAKQYFAKIPNRPVPKLKPRTEIKPLGVKRISLKLPAKLPVLMLGYATPTLVTTKDQWKPYALNVLANVLGGTDSSRMQNDLVRSQSIASSISVYYSPFNLHGNLFQVIAVPAPGYSIKALKSAIIKEIKQIRSEKISPNELDRIKAQMKAAKVFSLDSLQSQAMMLGGAEMIGLSWRDGENYVQSIDKVTVDQIQQVAKEYLKARRLTVGVLQPLVKHKGVKP